MTSARESLRSALIGLLVALPAAAVPVAPGYADGPRHGIAMHGEPALPAGFSALPYVNPNAPKGGRIVQGVLGTFDSLNPFVVKGSPAIPTRGTVHESLLTRNYNEPFSLYGLLAKTVETDDARTYVAFTLDPDAKFSDSQPVTPDDVIFSWQLLRDKGRPNYRTYYAKVAKATATGPATVRFDFDTGADRELPLILGLMPILPKHATDATRFDETTLKPMIGSGPYVFGDIDPGRRLTLRRNPNYWGRDRPIMRGIANFDELRFDYYRDSNAVFEGFKKGLLDVRVETDPGRWETGYDFPALRDGRVVKESFTSGLPQGMSGLAFNTRRPVFEDIRVREAIIQLFDFEWINKNYFFGRYQRSAGYFDGSELSAHLRPADARERALLAPFPGAVRPEVMEGIWSPPKTDGTGRDRSLLKRAIDLLQSAGYDLVGSVMRNRATGKQLSFEILVTTKDQERLALDFSGNLKRAGIDARIRVADAVQYDQRRITYDFDMMQYRWEQSLSPGNEQTFYWGSAAASENGSRNYMGIQSPAVDAMIAAMLKATRRDDFVAAVRALDRVLMSGLYVVPLYHATEQWVARWSHVRHPPVGSLSGFVPETWWSEKDTGQVTK